MKKNISILIIVFLISSFISCKNEWKLPTEVGFKIDINREPNSDGTLVFTDGEIIIETFEFDGEREQGDDVYFSKSFEQGLIIPFSSSSVVEELDFDIPQGTYSKIVISFETFDKFDNINIIVNGFYTNSSSERIPIRFEFTPSEEFDIVAVDYSGSNQIILNKDHPVNAQIEINPIHWFQVVSSSLLDDADLVDINGTQTLLISDDENEDIFDLIIDRLDESLEAVFR